MDLISREEAVDAIMSFLFQRTTTVTISTSPVTTAKAILARVPTVEPKRGKWNLTADGYRCTRCSYKAQTTSLPMYCPNCGARMEE